MRQAFLPRLLNRILQRPLCLYFSCRILDLFLSSLLRFERGFYINQFQDWESCQQSTSHDHVEQAAIAARFGSPLGRMVAYEQPALTRVVQAAGRLIRRPDDRAALCLIDTRYQTRPYRDLLPVHWQLNTTPSPRLATLLDDFWNKG